VASHSTRIQALPRPPERASGEEFLLANKAEFCRLPPDQVRAPARVTFQQLAYCLSLTLPPILVPIAQDLFVLRTHTERR